MSNIVIKADVAEYVLPTDYLLLAPEDGGPFKKIAVSELPGGETDNNYTDADKAKVDNLPEDTREEIAIIDARSVTAQTAAVNAQSVANTALTAAQTAQSDLESKQDRLPDITGQAGKILGTDGSNLLWKPESGAKTNATYCLSDFGVKQDGKIVRDVSITSGSPVITSASASFVSGDVGKSILLNKQLGTIISVQSSTQATVSYNLAATATNRTAKYGTDDTAAIQEAMDFAVANKGAKLIKGTGISIIAAPPTIRTGPIGDVSSQLWIPYTSYQDSVTGGSVNLALFGEFRPSYEAQMLIETAAPKFGPILQSIYVDTEINSAVLSFSPSPTGGLFESYNFTSFDTSDIVVVVETGDTGFAYPNRMAGIDLTYTNQMRIGDLLITCSCPVSSATGPSGYPSVGLKTPIGNNHAYLIINSLVCVGFSVGAVLNEHTQASKITALGSGEYGIIANGGYGINIDSYCSEGNKIHLRVSTNAHVNIGVLEAEQFLSGYYTFDTGIGFDGDATPQNCSVNIGEAIIHEAGGTKRELTLSDNSFWPAVKIGKDEFGKTYSAPNYHTSSTRPAAKYIGQIGYNTDTDALEMWNGVTWFIFDGTLVPAAPLPVFSKVFDSSIAPMNKYEAGGLASIASHGGSNKLYLTGTAVAVYISGQFTIGDVLNVTVIVNDQSGGASCKLYLGNSSGADYLQTLVTGTNAFSNINTSAFTGADIGFSNLSGDTWITSITVAKNP